MMNSSHTGTVGGATRSTVTRQQYKAQGLLPNLEGLSFCSVEVDSQWYIGWFRIHDGMLEVYASGQIRTAPIHDASLEHINAVLRELLTEIVRQQNGK